MSLGLSAVLAAAMALKERKSAIPSQALESKLITANSNTPPRSALPRSRSIAADLQHKVVRRREVQQDLEVRLERKQQACMEYATYHARLEMPVLVDADGRVSGGVGDRWTWSGGGVLVLRKPPISQSLNKKRSRPQRCRDGRKIWGFERWKWLLGKRDCAWSGTRQIEPLRSWPLCRPRHLVVERRSGMDVRCMQLLLSEELNGCSKPLQTDWSVEACRHRGLYRLYRRLGRVFRKSFLLAVTVDRAFCLPNTRLLLASSMRF